MTTRPFVLDMETSDPDDFITLLMLLGHPLVDLRAVTVTPGTREQVGLVRRALVWFGKEKDIEVGAYNADHPKQCVSKWHYDAYALSPWHDPSPIEEGWRVLKRHLGPDTTMVTGAPLKNLGALLSTQSLLSDLQHPNFGRLVIQGGFAGEGVIPPEKQLEKFRGRVTCPSFNLNGDPKSVQRVLDYRAWFTDIRFVGKQVCHGVRYDSVLHEQLEQAVCGTHTICDCACHTGIPLLHDRTCCAPCPWCKMEKVVGGHAQPSSRTEIARSQILHGMGYYLDKHPDGKMLHDPLAACCAIDPTIGEWAEVEVYRERGEWGSRLAPGSGVRIITDYDHEKFVSTFLMR